MKIALFCHSLVSDWNHGNAHFLRGVVSELRARGHLVRVYEPGDGWSRRNLLASHGERMIDAFESFYPGLRSDFYDLDRLDLDRMLHGTDLVLVHEWSDPTLVRAIGEHRRRTRSFRLLFHDTHHRMVTAPEEMRRFDLANYDGVLAFGEALRQVYEERDVVERVWTWHEAADARVFRPLRGPEIERRGDLVWIGNWGDEERSAELMEYVVGPTRDLRLQTRVHGVRYPEAAKAELARARIAYLGWIPNFRVPEVFASFRFTVHVPRRPYLEALPGIPTIRVFEALACGIPLVCARWSDSEGLFTPGADYLWVDSGDSMTGALRDLVEDPRYARDVAEHGRRTVLERHTCAHRVDDLLAIARELGVEDEPEEAVA